MRARGGKFANGTPYARFGRGQRKLVILNSIMDVVQPADSYPRLASLFYLAFQKEFEVWLVGRKRGLPLGYTIEDMARDAAEGIREIGEPVHLMGLSMGSFLAQTVAATHPELVRGLVLVSTGARPSMNEQGRPRVGRNGNDAPKEDLVPDLSALLEGATSGFRRIFYGALLRIFVNKRWSRGDYIVSTLAWMKFNGLEKLAHIQAPTLVLAGRDDAMIPEVHFRELADGIARGQLQLVKGGHGHYLDNRVAFAREVKHFVRGIEGESDLSAPEPDPAAVFQLG